MKFGFDVEQVALRDAVRRILDSRLGSARLRELWETETGRDGETWARLVDIGLPAMLIDTEHGGLGASELDVFLVLEELGRAAVPDAFIESWMLAPALLGPSGHTEFARTWLPRLADGTARATVALGGSRLVADAHVSDVVIVEVDGDVRAFGQDEVRWRPVPSMNPSQRLAQVEPVVGGVQLDPAGLELARARRAVGAAAVLSGVSSYLVEAATAYAKVREQFGRPIGSFQAVKHLLAEAFSRNELARHAAVHAAYAVATGSSSAADGAVLAQLCAIEAARESNRVSLQVHGGIGFTWEHDLHIWLQHGKSIELSYGARHQLAVEAGSGAFVDAARRAV